MKAKITYYGVRGSTPVSGKNYLIYGGNTTCLFFETEHEKVIIDAGTGIRILGLDLMKREFGKGQGNASLILTHTHWDHIQGFPFFIPAYIPGNRFEIFGETKKVPVAFSGRLSEDHTWDIERTLSMQQMFMFFPASTHNMSSNHSFHPVLPQVPLEKKNLRIKFLRMHHPNISLGIRFEFGKKVYCFCTDVEHSNEMTDKMIDFVQGAEVLSYDCQYTPDEYENGKVGWGHSTYVEAAKIASCAGVKQLHMIHHDPLHDDVVLKSMEELARGEFTNTFLVPEGYQFEI